MDELFTFIGDKKRNLYSHSGSPQNLLYFRLGGGLGPHPALQQVVDQALKAKCYFSDGFDAHHKQRFPNYEHHVMDFVSPLF